LSLCGFPIWGTLNLSVAGRVNKGREGENHKDTKNTKAWKCYLSWWQTVKKKSKRWIVVLEVQNEYLIHLFDFFFFSSGYRQAGYYFQAFVLFVSLWFSPSLPLFTLPATELNLTAIAMP
jgi:hypothetical protein